MFTSDNTECSTKISIISQNKFNDWLSKQPLFIRNWCLSNNFKGEAGKILKIPYDDGRLKEVVIGEGESRDLRAIARFASENKGNYFLFIKYSDSKELEIMKAWSWGNYEFKNKSKSNLLYVKEPRDLKFLNFYTQVTSLARNLINLPANEINPLSYYQHIKKNKFFKGFRFINHSQKDILKKFPLTNAVGKASETSPRVIEVTNKKITNKDRPLVIIGKGVTFDTGGLNIKPGNSMRNMKKDMAGSSIALSLFLLANYFFKKTKIVLIIPLAENSISSNSMRPGDIYRSQKGKSVEIANTDAEGRLLLADALERAELYNPSMVIDFATLTGAARVALGEDLPAYFTNNENIAKQIEELNNTNLLCWRLPLYKPYLNKIKSTVADISNASLDGMAGSITAALFLQEFISFKAPWVHFDTFGWSNGSYLGTHGGALQGLDLMLSLLQKNYQ